MVRRHPLRRGLGDGSFPPARHRYVPFESVESTLEKMPAREREEHGASEGDNCYGSQPDQRGRRNDSCHRKQPRVVKQIECVAEAGKTKNQSTPTQPA